MAIARKRSPRTHRYPSGWSPALETYLIWSYPAGIACTPTLTRSLHGAWSMGRAKGMGRAWAISSVLPFLPCACRGTRFQSCSPLSFGMDRALARYRARQGSNVPSATDFIYLRSCPTIIHGSFRSLQSCCPVQSADLEPLTAPPLAPLPFRALDPLNDIPP